MIECSVSAKSLGLPYLSAYLDSVGSNFTHGANFATAGSTIRPQNTTLQQSGFSPISLNVQYNEFYDFLPRSQVARTQGHNTFYFITTGLKCSTTLTIVNSEAEGNYLLCNVGGVFEQLMPKAEAFSRGLYTFDIGQNDLTAGLFMNMSVAQVKAIVPDVLDQFKKVVKVIQYHSCKYEIKCFLEHGMLLIVLKAML